MRHDIAQIGIVLMVFVLIAPILQQSVIEGAIPISETAKYCFAITFVIGLTIVCGTRISEPDLEHNGREVQEPLMTQTKKD
jgi:hypothetical protein